MVLERVGSEQRRRRQHPDPQRPLHCCRWCYRRPKPWWFVRCTFCSAPRAYVVEVSATALSPSTACRAVRCKPSRSPRASRFLYPIEELQWAGNRATEREKTRTPRVAEKLSHPGPPDAKCILIHCGTQRRPNTRGHDGVEERVRHPFIDIAVMPPRWSGGGKGVGESVDMAKIPTRMVSATTRLLAYTLERDRREG